MHNLIHLASDSKHFRPLQTFSAYKFQSFLGKLKLKCRSAYKIHQQMHNRTYEMRSITSGDKSLKVCNRVLSKPIKNTTMYLRCAFSLFTITASQQGEDCIYMKSKMAVRAIHFLNDQGFEGIEIYDIQEYYANPMNLMKLHNIFI